MLRWEGAVNAHQVAPGLVRMGRHEWLTQHGWSQMSADGYETVVDLRAPNEIGRREGDPDADPAVSGVKVISAPTEDADHPEFRRRFVPYLDHPESYEQYLALFGDRVLIAMLAIAEAPSGVVVHCAGGRDRTGLIVALGQALASVPTGQIVDGYARAASGINAHLANRIHPYERHMSGAAWDDWLGDRLSALEAFVASVDAGFLLRSEGASKADLAAIRARFSASE